MKFSAAAPVFATASAILKGQKIAEPARLAIHHQLLETLLEIETGAGRLAGHAGVVKACQ